MLAVLLAGCRMLKSEAVRTEYRYVTRWDSVFVDCTDTFYVEVRGDTVRVKEKVTEREIRYTILTDTLRVGDTVTVTERVMANGDCPKVRRWPWMVTGFCVAILIIFAAKIIIRIYLKR